jgi:hypothetical protein
MDGAAVAALWLKTKSCRPLPRALHPAARENPIGSFAWCARRWTRISLTHQRVWQLQEHEACQSIHISIIRQKISMLPEFPWKGAVDCKSDA